MDSFPAMSLGRLEKNLDDWESSRMFSHASFESQLKGFRLTCTNHIFVAGTLFYRSLARSWLGPTVSQPRRIYLSKATVARRSSSNTAAPVCALQLEVFSHLAWLCSTAGFVPPSNSSAANQVQLNRVFRLSANPPALGLHTTEDRPCPKLHM